MRKASLISVSFRTVAIASVATAGCAAEDSGPDLENRAYIVARDSDHVTVIDLKRLEIIGQIRSEGVANHMAELNSDFTKLYIGSAFTNESIVVDATRLEITSKIPTGTFPTHLALSRDGNVLAVLNEEADSISFIDPETDQEVKRLSGFYAPHFMRFSLDSKYGYVANIGAYHLSRVDMASLEIVDHIALDGYAGPPSATFAPDETGFADAQIDPDGVLYAAHNASARVLVYDTVANQKLTEHSVGPRPWIAYAEHPFPNLPRRQLVPAFGDQTVSLIRPDAPIATLHAGDVESFGVNFSPLAPDRAFVMNRARENITVVDTAAGRIADVIITGGTTETASTTADGRWIVATVSSSNQVVVIDAMTHEIVKTFNDVGKYPWSVTIPRGQNYCH
jgi:DNA-binding beta-propeller fold protein YncE